MLRGNVIVLNLYMLFLAMLAAQRAIYIFIYLPTSKRGTTLAFSVLMNGMKHSSQSLLILICLNIYGMDWHENVVNGSVSPGRLMLMTLVIT